MANYIDPIDPFADDVENFDSETSCCPECSVPWEETARVHPIVISDQLNELYWCAMHGAFVDA